MELHDMRMLIKLCTFNSLVHIHIPGGPVTSACILPLVSVELYLKVDRKGAWPLMMWRRERYMTYISLITRSIARLQYHSCYYQYCTPTYHSWLTWGCGIQHTELKSMNPRAQENISFKIPLIRTLVGLVLWNRIGRWCSTRSSRLDSCHSPLTSCSISCSFGLE